MQISRVHIHPQLTSQHEQALLSYLNSVRNLSPAQWLILFEAVELLHQSTFVIDGITYTFRQFYNQFIDTPFADTFINQFIRLTELEEADVLQAAFAKKIVVLLQGISGFSAQQKTTRLLMVYCLYWWGAFARGYIFEQKVFRDLVESDIEFVAHDITNRQERFSPYDIVVAGMRGDIKYTTYFLAMERQIGPVTDFFITRAYDASQRKWRMVVAMRNDVWQRLDGETIPTSRENLASVLPQAASITIGNEQLIVIEYDDWKERVRRHIKSKGEKQDESTNIR